MKRLIVGVFAAVSWCALAADEEVRIGILSDIHVSTEQDLSIVRKAFEYFRDSGADGVLIAGDMANGGITNQLMMVGHTWYEVFPDDKAPDGRHVEKLFVYGNHDVADWSLKSKDDRHVICTHREECWEQAFREPYRPIWLKRVKGYAFIGAHWDEEKGLGDFLAAHDAELKGTRPFFYAQHAHPGNTVGGPWAWGNDGGRATKLLSAYPNAVAFSGHSHYSLTDERTIWQGAFTSVGTSSLRYIYAQVGRENGENWGSRGTRPLQMPSLPESQGEQGLLMTVSSDRITFARRDILNGKSLGPDWVVPLDGTKPYAFAPRKAAAVAPEFAPGAKAEVRKVKGKDRSGVELEQVVVSFPAAQPSRTSRVYEYEVRASLADIEDVREPVCVRRVLAEGFYLAPEDDAKTATCVIDASLFPPKNNIIFEIRPLDCFGNAGRPLTRVW